MTINEAESARLLCIGGFALHGKRRPITRPAQIRVGTIAELVAYIGEQDPDELWRYTIITVADEHHIKGAELRALLPAR